jgi:hypothetical protein
MKHKASCLLLSAAFVGNTACHLQSGFGRATNVPKGHARAGGLVELDLAAVRLLPKNDVPLPGAQVAMNLHYGVSDKFEIGARMWGAYLPNFLTTFGGAVDTKWQLRKGKVDIALASAVGYHTGVLGGAAWHSLQVTLPLLFGVNMGDNQFVFGPRIADYVLASYGQNTVNTFWGGLSLGYAWRIKEKLDLLPELIVLYSPVSFNGREPGQGQVGVTLFQLGFGLQREF